MTRLVLLSILSCGLYEAYWSYKNWKFLKERDNLNISPFWRGIFGVFFCHRLLRAIYEDEEANAIVQANYSPGSLATGWVILIILGNLLSRAPGIGPAIISNVMPSYLCLVPVQNYINSLNEGRRQGVQYHPWSIGHVVCAIFGVIVWGLIFMALTAY